MIKAVIFLTISLISISAMAEDVPLGECILGMNIDRLNLQVTHYNTDVEDTFSIDHTVLSDPSGDRSLVSVVKYINHQSINTLEGSLVRFMNDRGCIKVTGDCWKNGYIADGLSRGCKKRYWGVALPLDLDNSTFQFSRGLIVLAGFEDADLNEKLVRDVRAENLRCSD